MGNVTHFRRSPALFGAANAPRRITAKGFLKVGDEPVSRGVVDELDGRAEA